MSKIIQESLGLPIIEDLFNHSEEKIRFPEQVESQPDISQNPDEYNGELGLMTLLDEDGPKFDEDMEKFSEDAKAKAEDLIELGYSVDPKAAGSILSAAAKMMQLALEAKRSSRDSQLQSMKLQLEALKASKIKTEQPAQQQPTSSQEQKKIVNRNDLLKNK